MIEDRNDIFDDEDELYQENKYLLCHIGNEIYGIMIGYVTDIIELQPITYIPNMPVYVKGVINLRNRVIPVIDLRLRFGLEPKAYDDRTCIVVINIEEIAIGFIVDTVSEVKEIPDADIDDPPKFHESGIDSSYIAGLGRVNEEVKILLDVEQILSQYDIQLLSNEITQKEGT